MNQVRSGYIQGQPDGGPACEAFERALEQYYDVPHARVFNSATSALHAALVAIGIKRATVHPNGNPRVLVPAISMSASGAVILQAGGIPIFCDISRTDYCLDWDWTKLRRGHSFRSWRAAILVHLFGYHARYPKHTLWPIVHDAAQSPSLRPVSYRGQDIWVYSLNQHKVINCGEGGYALTYRSELADRLHAVRNHGESEYPDILGHNYRMTEMQAEVAMEELGQLDERLAARRHVCSRFWPDSTNRDWYIAPANGIQVPEVKARVGYVKPIYQHPYFVRHNIHRGAPCPVAEDVSANLVYYMVSDIMEAHAKSFGHHPGLQQSGPARPVPRYSWATDQAAR